jgi:hypothetical protein
VLENCLQSNSEMFLLNGNLINLSNRKIVPIYYLKPKITFKTLIYNNPILSPSFWVLKKSLLNDCVCFTLPFSGYKGVDDWYFSIRLLLFYSHLKITYVKKKIIFYCIHESNYSHNLQEQLDGAIAVLKSLGHVNLGQQRYINQRIKTLEFARLFYLKSTLLSVLKYPATFLLFIYHYMGDYNRIIRFVHRYIRGLRIKRTNKQY